MKNIAIVTPNKDAYSETFVRMQIEKLPAKLVLHGGNLPAYAEKEKIFSLNFLQRNLQRLSSLIGKKKYSYEKSLIKILKREKIDVLLIQFGIPAVALLDICRNNNIPIFVHFHGYDAHSTEVIEKHGNKYRELFQYAKGIVAVSKTMEAQLIKLGCPKEKIHTFPCAPSEIFGNIEPHYQNKIFFSIGRFVDKKAPYLTILAFEKVLRKFPDAKLRMAGNGPLLNTCKNIVSVLNLSNNVEFIGVITPEQVKSEMENALGFVQHSIIADNGDSEGTPVAVLEASLAKLPVIATRHAGIKDVVIEGETGLLCDEKDTETMANNMINILENNNLAKELGEKGRFNIISYYSEAIYIKRLQLMINESYKNS